MRVLARTQWLGEIARRQALNDAVSQQELARRGDALARAGRELAAEREARLAAQSRVNRARSQAGTLAAELGGMTARLAASEHERRVAVERADRAADRGASLRRRVRALERQLGRAERRAQERRRSLAGRGDLVQSRWHSLAVVGCAVLFGVSIGVVGVAFSGHTVSSALIDARRPRLVPADASALARTQIPRRYLTLYVAAGRRHGLDWAKLAAVGELESQHGQSRMPGVHAGSSPKGAQGPMQFLPATWRRYGLSGDGNGPITPYDPADAIDAAASYLRANGAPEDWPAALYAYNHSYRYVRKVLALSARYKRD